jgi:hypothetical protein
VKRLIVLAVLVGLAGTACAGQSAGAGSVDSGIRGKVVEGPTCPVEQLSSPCPDRPVAATVVVKDTFGKEVATARSGTDGKFEIRLAPGTYVLSGERSEGLDRVSKPTTVTVRSGRFTDVVIEFDTGIR